MESKTIHGITIHTHDDDVVAIEGDTLIHLSVRDKSFQATHSLQALADRIGHANLETFTPEQIMDALHAPKM